MLFVDSLIVAGIANAVLLALASGLASRRDRRWAWLCAMFCLLVVTFTAIIVSHRSDGMVERAANATEQLAWFVGPVLFLYLRIALGYGLGRRFWLHFALPAAIVLVGTPLILFGVYEPIPVRLLVAYQVAYTAASIVLLVRRPEKSDRTAMGYWWPVSAVSAMVGIHVAQLARMTAWGAVNADIVPVIGSISVMAMMFLALAVAQQAPRKPADRYAKSALPEGRARAIFDEARGVIAEGGLYRRFDLTLGDVAASMGVGVHHLSQSLSVAGDTSFNELVSRLRVEEAKRLLVEPRNAGVAVEPLGMEAGFRSRSAFYAAFREQTGLTPAEYRKREGPMMSSPTGQDTPIRD